MKTRGLLLLIVLSITWYILTALDLPDGVLLAASLVGLAGLVLAAWLGRRALNRHPTLDAAARVTADVHNAVIALLGSSTIAAVRLFRSNPGWYIPIPDAVGLVLVLITGLLLLASTANLILSGLGVPVAILPTRRLATDWLYDWTRNPIVLSALLFLFSLGIWMHSTWLVAWTVLLVTPTAILLLLWFEERELEIRFGAEYLAYKARVPMLIPRPPARANKPAVKTGPKL